MRDRSKEIDMLEDTLKILKQGWYEKWQKDTAETFRKRNAGDTGVPAGRCEEKLF